MYPFGHQDKDTGQKKPSIRKALSILILWLLFFNLLNFILLKQFLLAQEKSSAATDIEKRLTQVNQQITQLKSRLQEEEKKEKSLLSKLEKIRLTKSVIENEIEAISLRRTMIYNQLVDLNQKISATELSLKKEKEAVETTLVTLYKFGRLDFMYFFLKANNLETLLRESKNLTFLARYQGQIIQSYLQTLDRWQQLEQELKQKEAEDEALLKQARENQSRLLAEEQKNQQLLMEIRKNKNVFQQMMAELQESASELQKLLTRLQNQEIALPYPFIPMNERQGKLPWPLNGRIITRYGPEKHPKFNTVIINNGIEIAPVGKEKTIKAVHGGRVVFADYFQGYGNLIIIDHGLSYYTLYGHCSSFLVKKGDLVQPGQPIAVVGDSDSIKGECLYFEVRHKARAEDPLKWLKRR
ncbi:MAG TPA: hypothetical protein ENO29_02675 [Candidatus Aminicenantes bacterium]|nr:MAG: hypothetical protein C0168_08950 [Candidatus Aminicenantes bacterium]HEK85246.1 hypothetical protein [Candidatus Aminicenantes bacterium]